MLDRVIDKINQLVKLGELLCYFHGELVATGFVIDNKQVPEHTACFLWHVSINNRVI